MATPGAGHTGTADTATRPGPAAGPGPARRPHSTETKAAYKTTEFYIYLAAVAAVLIASWVIGTTDGHRDYLRGDRAWFFIVLLTLGYLVSRGLAKAGSREPYGDR